MKVAAVTGAASGIGRSTAERLARDGWAIVGVDLDGDGLETALGKLDAQTAAVAGDVRERTTHERAAEAAQMLGTLFGWVNAAGIWLRTRAHDFHDADLERVLGVNLIGSALGCSVACARFLAASTPGAIVNVSSIEAISAFPNSLAYEASKGGVDALTRQIAVDYGPAGIRCNGIRPGAIMTPLSEFFLADSGDREGTLESWRQMSPLGRIGEADEVAAVIAFLLSDDARFVTGELVNVDGGAVARCFRYPPDPDIQPTAGV